MEKMCCEEMPRAVEEGYSLLSLNDPQAGSVCPFCGWPSNAKEKEERKGPYSLIARYFKKSKKRGTLIENRIYARAPIGSALSNLIAINAQRFCANCIEQPVETHTFVKSHGKEVWVCDACYNASEEERIARAKAATRRCAKLLYGASQ